MENNKFIEKMKALDNQKDFIKFLIFEEGRFDFYDIGIKVLKDLIICEEDCDIESDYAQTLIKKASELFPNEFWINKYIVNHHKEELIEAIKLGEIPFCERIESIYKRDMKQNYHNESLINAMWELQVASQQNEWNGVENELYQKTQDHLMKRLGLTDEEIKEIRQ